MELMSLSGLQGSLESNLAPIVETSEGNRLRLNESVMAKFNLAESDRVDIAIDNSTKTPYFRVCGREEKQFRAITKTGRFQHPTMHSALTTFGGLNSSWEITDETVQVGETVWFKMTLFVETAPMADSVSETVADTPAQEDAGSEEAGQDVDASTNEGSDVTEPTPEEVANATEEDNRDAIPELPEEEY